MEQPSAASEHAVIWREGESVCLQLQRRKNLQASSGVLRRSCTCRGCAVTCPVHALWDRFLAKFEEGAHPWAHIAPGKARDVLRTTLSTLGVVDPSSYGTHDFRRGHAEVGASVLLRSCMSCSLWQDMRRSGCTLAQILRAGQWRSASFMHYLNEVELEKAGSFRHVVLVVVVCGVVWQGCRVRGGG